MSYKNMSCSRTCNPYFVKSLNLRTLTLNGDGEIEDADMLELKTFLRKSDINPNFANVLQEVWVHNMQTLKQYLQDAFKFVHNQIAYPHFGPVLLEWQKAIWNDVLDIHSKQEDIQACLRFLQLCKRSDDGLLRFEQTIQRVSMSAFLEKNDVISTFKETLRNKNIAIDSGFTLREYINKKKAELSKKSYQRVAISDVTPFERHLWNDIVSKQTSPQNQEDAKKFIKLATVLLYSKTGL